MIISDFSQTHKKWKFWNKHDYVLKPRYFYNIIYDLLSWIDTQADKKINWRNICKIMSDSGSGEEGLAGSSMCFKKIMFTNQ